MRPAHHQQPREDVNEHAADPRGHRVRLRGAEVDIQYDDGYAYTGMEKRGLKNERKEINKSLGSSPKRI